ncbi:MAG TPA: AAA family ATPase [Acidilobales archaeon]|nr:AAA family ATPase [Acidilobales archaeon]
MVKPNIIVISGVPGVGKSAVAKALAKALNGHHVELSKVVIDKGLYLSYDEETLSYIINEEKVKEYVRELSRQHELVIIDSHYGEIIDDDLIIKIFVLRMNPLRLIKRLKKRGWPKKKVKENLEAEALGVCLINALESHPEEKVCEIDVTGKSVKEVVDIIIEMLSTSCKPLYIDWFSDPKVVELIARLDLGS